MPIRFTSPSLGGQREMFLHAGEWELGVAYRRLTADEWFVGDRVDIAQAPGGQPVRFSIHSVDVSMAYGVTDRVSLQLTVPFSTGTNSRIHPDGARRVTSATGLGDVNLIGRMWLADPAAVAGATWRSASASRRRPGRTPSRETSAFRRGRCRRRTILEFS